MLFSVFVATLAALAVLFHNKVVLTNSEKKNYTVEDPADYESAIFSITSKGNFLNLVGGGGGGGSNNDGSPPDFRPGRWQLFPWPDFDPLFWYDLQWNQLEKLLLFPTCMTKTEIFKTYLEDMQSSGLKPVSLPTFCRLWKSKFRNVIIPKVTFWSDIWEVLIFIQHWKKYHLLCFLTEIINLRVV